jgi:hypothetical protein
VSGVACSGACWYVYGRKCQPGCLAIQLLHATGGWASLDVVVQVPLGAPIHHGRIHQEACQHLGLAAADEADAAHERRGVGEGDDDLNLLEEVLIAGSGELLLGERQLASAEAPVKTVTVGQMLDSRWCYIGAFARRKCLSTALSTA